MSVKNGKIDIAVPAYNKAEWLDAFIESLIAQEFQNWRVIIRDDGSKDHTVDKIFEWQRILGERILILDNPKRVNLGFLGNYNAVLSACTSEFVMMGDPDDVWLPNKISLSLKKIIELQKLCAKNIPLLVSTDAEVVDSELNLIFKSYRLWEKSNWNCINKFNRVIMEGHMLGPTMILNQALLQKALPIPSNAAYQDWWLTMVSAKFGKNHIINRVTLKYRRNDSNDSVQPYYASTFSRAIQKLPEVR